jgi:hypothetical protein
MKKPRLAIEFETYENDEWDVGLTKYFDIDDKDEIMKCLTKERKITRLKRFYYADENGIEIDWNKEKS